MDPAPLAKHGLIEELLERLAKAGTSGSDRPSGNTATPDPKSTSPSVTTVISLLSTLCRGSPVITEVCCGFVDEFYECFYLVKILFISLFSCCWHLNFLKLLTKHYKAMKGVY
jgi:hypothetical protein